MLVLRHEGVSRVLAERVRQRLAPRRIRIHRDVKPRPRGVCEGGVADAIVAQLPAIEIHRQARAVEGEALGLRQHAPILRRDQVAAEHQVLHGLRGAAPCIKVAANEPRALHAHEIAPVVRLGDQFVRGRRIDDDVRARQDVSDARLRRCPQILAELDAEAKTPQVEQLIAPHREAAQVLLGEERRHVRAGGEPPELVELLVVRIRRLRHGTEHRAPPAHERRVQEAPVHEPPRRPHHERRLAARAHHFDQGRAGLVEQQIGREEVLAGVAREGKLRRQDEGGPGACLRLVRRKQRRRVGPRVADHDRGRHRRHAEESMLHVVHPEHCSLAGRHGSAVPAKTPSIAGSAPSMEGRLKTGACDPGNGPAVRSARLAGRRTARGCSARPLRVYEGPDHPRRVSGTVAHHTHHIRRVGT